MEQTTNSTKHADPSIIDDNTKVQCINNVYQLFEKYSYDAYMIQRLQTHLLSLPTTLDNEDKNHQERIKRNDFLTNEQQIFIQVFLSKNRYYYLPNNNCFYEYVNNTFSSVKEDHIQHKLLTNISKDGVLTQWKYKTKVNIIKQIKDRHLFKCVPEPETIQNVLKHLYPSNLFNTKTEAKYFLTVLGDNILKKNTDLIFLIKPSVKRLLLEIDNIIYITTGFTGPTFNFMTKYHENYSFENCRIINMNDTIHTDIWKSILKKIGLDLLCLAVHYSNRCDSETFIENKVDDEEIKNYTLFLKNNSQQVILDNFCNTCIQKVDNHGAGPSSVGSSRINWKNMHYLWKNYISGSSLPNMIYSSQLKTLLKEKYQYDESADCFLNIISKYTPYVSDFILFWDKNISVLPPDKFENDFEIDELCGLFKKWVLANNNETFLCSKNGNITEHDVVKIINHFYPSIEIVDNKYVLNISCFLWDKTGEVNHYLQLFKKYYNEVSLKKGTADSLISFDEVYDFYCEKVKESDSKCVNKRFFEKYLFYNFNSHIQYEKFINSTWVFG
jgi:hypothetical protein